MLHRSKRSYKPHKSVPLKCLCKYEENVRSEYYKGLKLVKSNNAEPI